MSFSGWRQLLRQSPGIAVLFQTMHDIIGNTVALFFCQFLTKAAHELRAPLSANAIAKLSKSPRVRTRYENEWGTALSIQRRIGAVGTANVPQTKAGNS
jgi:hypothetical protein